MSSHFTPITFQNIAFMSDLCAYQVVSGYLFKHIGSEGRHEESPERFDFGPFGIARHC